MTSAIYAVSVDFGRDASYGHANSNITSYVLDMTWNNGMTDGAQEFAAPAQLTLTLDNSSGAFNLEESGATFYTLFAEGQLIRVQATFASTTTTLFIGKLMGNPPLTMPTYGENVLTLTARDLMDELLDIEFMPLIDTDVTTDEALKQPFQVGAIALPYAASFWILGVSILGTDTILLGEADMIAYETGQTTLAYVGDIAGGNTTVRAQHFLRDIVTAECVGRYFYNSRTGKFTFHNRHHDINPTSAVTFDKDDYEGCDYIPLSKVTNQITIHYQPREVGAASSVIYSIDNPLRLAGGETKTLTVRYKDATVENARIGATAFITPQSGVDYIANTEEDGSGKDVTTKMIVSVTFGASSAAITLVNPRPRRAWFTTLQLRGTPLRSFGRESVTSAPDGDSLHDYDLRPMTLNIPAVDDDELAQQYAASILSQRRVPFAEMRRLTFLANMTDTRMTQALTRAPGDAITVQNDDFDHDAVYAIVGEQHHVSGGGEYPHEVTWILKSLNTSQYWVLGVVGFSELGSTTILAF